MERMNLMHYGINEYTNEMIDSAEEAYPLLRTFKV